MLSLLTTAVASALLLTSAYPKLAFWPVSAVAIVPYFYVLLLRRERLSWRQVWLSAFVFAAVWHIASIWWIGYVTVTGMLMLSLFIALLFAIVLTVGWRLAVKGVWPCVALPAVWMVFETIVTYFLTGFPWLLLGYTWRPWNTIIQVSDIAGVYAVSWLIILINAAIAQLIVGALRGESWTRRLSGAIVALAVATTFCLYGVWRAGTLGTEKPETEVRLACVQANIPSLVKHDSSRDVDILRKHAYWALDAVRSNVDVIVWPETALPGYYFDQGLTFRVVTNLLKHINTPLLVGLSRRHISDDGYLRYYNSVGLIEPGGAVVGLYDKVHLVVFGEYVPLERYLPFLKLVTPIEGSFSSGAGPRTLVLAVDGRTVEFGPLICFEDVFGYLSRAMTRIGADVLLNLTNDGWFHDSPEPYQHAALSAFRAVETRRPLVRSTNTGITTLIDRLGRTRALLRRKGKCTEVSGVMHATVPIYRPNLTFYTRFGDWFLVCWCVLSAALVVTYRWRTGD